jgi:hypothetical protein
MKPPRQPHPDLLRFLAAYPRRCRSLHQDARNCPRCRAHSYEVIVDAFSAVAAAYTWTDRQQDAFCHIAAYTNYVNLGFNRGTELPDPDRLLKGIGNLTRHIIIRQVEDLDSASVTGRANSFTTCAQPMNHCPDNER